MSQKQFPPPYDTIVRVDGVRLSRWLFAFLVAGILACGALDYLFEFQRLVPDKSIRRLFNCARESSIPTWYSATLLWFVGLTLLAIFFLVKKRGAAGRTRLGWLILACFFLYMGVDDAAVVHERLGTYLDDTVRDDPAGLPGWIRWVFDLPAYSWLIFLGPIFAVLGIFTLVFLWKHFGRHGLRLWPVLGLTCYVVAVGLDALERLELGDGPPVFEQIAEAGGWTRWQVSHLSKLTEELLEMLGTACFAYGAMRYFVAEAEGLWFAFGSRERTRASP